MGKGTPADCEQERAAIQLQPPREVRAPTVLSMKAFRAAARFDSQLQLNDREGRLCLCQKPRARQRQGHNIGTARGLAS